jgi:hypothetical protein
MYKYGTTLRRSNESQPTIHAAVAAATQDLAEHNAGEPVGGYLSTPPGSRNNDLFMLHLSQVI